MEKECIFDLIAAKRKSVFVFEDENFIAFLDSRPLFPGHTLLVPKVHVKTLYELPESLVSSLFINTTNR